MTWLLFIHGLAALFLVAGPPAQEGSVRLYGAECPSVATTAVQLLEHADAMRAERRLDAATHCFARAAEFAARDEDRATEGKARLGFGRAAYEQGFYDLAGAQGERARTLFADLGDRLSAAHTSRLLGNVAWMKGNTEEARRHYTLALDAFTELDARRERALLMTDLARTYSRAEAVSRVEKAIALAREAGAVDVEGLGLHLRADDHFSAGRFDEAIRDLLEAIERFQQADTPGHLADAYVSLGRIMRAHGRPEEAIGYYDRAIALQEKGGDVRGRVQSYNAKAIALSHLKRHAESREAYQRALELARQSGSERLINFQQGNLAAAYADAGDVDAAIRLLDDVLTRERSEYVLAYRHTSLATLRAKKNELDRAASHIETALTLAKKGDNRDLLPTIYYRAARIYRAQGRVDDALAATAEGIRIIEAIRSRLVPLDYLKRGFGEQWQAIFGVTIALLHERGQHGQALATSELGRARAFLDLLASRNLADRAPADLAVLAATKKGPESTGVATTANAEEIATTAARLGSSILSYWVDAEELFIWVTSPDGTVRATRVPAKREELEKLVLASVPAPEGSPTDALARLHRLLIEPVRAWLPARGEALTIVPHGPLFRVSFATLRDRSGRYLVEHYAIAYAPSISTLSLTSRRTVGKEAPYVVVADPSPLPESKPGLSPLPAARREAASIIRVIGSNRASMLSGRAATEPEVRRAAAGARVVHFATHGVITDEAPFDSFLALGREGPEDAADGRLTVRELYDVELNAELVVMSACRSATGRPSGDGITGLARALFYAGSDAVLATLWDVADEPSAILMSAFYRHWQRGADKRAALRLAQLELIGRLREGSITVKAGPGFVKLQEQPFYWAGYVFVGHP